MEADWLEQLGHGHVFAVQTLEEVLLYQMQLNCIVSIEIIVIKIYLHMYE